jgi:hypothetical protein
MVENICCGKKPFIKKNVNYFLIVWDIVVLLCAGLQIFHALVFDI